MDNKKMELHRLQSKIKGRLIFPEDGDYGSAKATWDTVTDHSPSVIVEAVNAKDVIETIKFAGEESQKVTVISTGHGPTRAADGEIMLKLSRMDAVRIDEDAGTAYVEAGAKWAKVLEEAAKFGLAPLMGSSSDVGAVGYTLGGGLGWLARKYGMSLDMVNYFDIVTSDAELRRAARDTCDDLFWALSGAGGAFGVVTSMEIRLVPEIAVYAGNLVYGHEDAAMLLEKYAEWTESLPDEMTSALVLANFPDLPIVPEPLRGKSAAMVRGCFAGNAEDGERIVNDLRGWKSPVIDMWSKIPFSAADTISNDPKEPIPLTITNVTVDELSDKTKAALLKMTFKDTGNSPILFTEVYHMGGKISSSDRSESVFAVRDAKYVIKVMGLVPAEESRHSFTAAVIGLKDELKDELNNEAYPNFLEGLEKFNHPGRLYPAEILDKLGRLKVKLDPDNMFENGLDIVPVP
ncbi:FAD-binding oxidoreductase [Youngiibacter fragilis]|uniref:Oxidoreductase n=1 Tax=Youngiibacter fragilis 232.1 TaxID=994573 RepID=V7I268_9CLOT|nr:FAD-binding oxidoreductase [Youngiibacter fragilis]ETA79381.1 oxidoreductase [Youngiibacter fragilis 232.1]